MSFPPAHMLIGAGLADVAWSATGPALSRRRAWAVGAFFAALPDVDLAIGYVSHRHGLHGTFTHSLSAVVLCTLLTVGIVGPRWSVVTGLGYGSHLLVDLLDARGPTNVTLGWPFSRAPAIGIDPIFQSVPIEPTRGPYIFLLSLVQPTALRMLAEQTAVAAAFCAGLLCVGWAIRQARARWSAAPLLDVADAPGPTGGPAA